MKVFKNFKNDLPTIEIADQTVLIFLFLSSSCSCQILIITNKVRAQMRSGEDGKDGGIIELLDD